MFEAIRIANVQDPVIPIVGQWVRETQGTISFGQGVAYYPPPPQAFENLSALLNEPSTHKYHAVDGLPALIEALTAKLQLENGIETGSDSPSRLCVTAGGNMAFVNAVLAITDPGDEIVILKPYYFNHEMAVRIAGCTPVAVATDENYQPIISGIDNAFNENTRAVLTVSPNNPSGAVYSEKTLRAINRLCRDRGVYHIHDEAYEYFTYGDVTHFSPGSIDGAGEHTISLFSLSKAYGFAGWRIGYMTFPERLQLSIKKIQDTILICPMLTSQHAAIGCLKAGAAYCRSRLPGYDVVRQVLQDELSALNDQCKVPSAQGAFYLLLRVKTRLDSMRLTERLVKEHRVAVMPGEAFGMKDDEYAYLRVSYGALEKEQALEGARRLREGLQTIVGE
ncbi:MAG: pyridoxal phosphate-dependent aminotransferase [bacterium]|nr:pyridoxal phosphate-dependent aminotransferase [bacterium]